MKLGYLLTALPLIAASEYETEFEANLWRKLGKSGKGEGLGLGEKSGKSEHGSGKSVKGVDGGYAYDASGEGSMSVDHDYVGSGKSGKGSKDGNGSLFKESDEDDDEGVDDGSGGKSGKSKSSKEPSSSEAMPEVSGKSGKADVNVSGKSGKDSYDFTYESGEDAFQPGMSAQGVCGGELTIDVPTGITGLKFVGYDVDPANIIRSTGSSNQIILKNYGARPNYTIDPSTGVTVTAGENCLFIDSGATTAAIAFAGGLLTGSPLLAATSLLMAGMPCAFAQDTCSNEIEVEIITMPIAKPPAGTNTCEGKKLDLDNVPCFVDGAVEVLGQAGADVSVGYTGGLDTEWEPVTDPYYTKGLCPVNVHWHLGAEHRSEGEYDETFDDNGPSSGRMLAEDARLGFRCKHYDASDEKFTTEYEWQHCVGMHVGETYEVHWPHSAVGACGTLNQYQTPFYDGVFCNIDAETFGTLTPENIKDAVGVQGQVFTIVNDESYYYPDLMHGMIVDGDMGKDITAYTGSTTGTSRDNEVCSQYAPITWQVDRKCHLISASTFDKMCADMKAQRDDMSDDLYAHGSRELVDDALASNNQQGNRKLGEMVYGNFVYLGA